MGKPRLLDLFCKAGGAAVGYHNAGFEVVGVDIEPQPHYPFEVHLADAMTYPLDGFNAYHASPPCQFAISQYHGHCENFIPAIRALLETTSKPYIIENIPRARRFLVNPFYLCGTMFGLKVKRHRYFETNFAIPLLLTSCACCGRAGFTNSYRKPMSSFARGAKLISVVSHNFSVPDARIAMGIDWMIGPELAQAIPPAYTEYIGKYLMRVIENSHSFENR